MLLLQNSHTHLVTKRKQAVGEHILMVYTQRQAGSSQRLLVIIPQQVIIMPTLKESLQLLLVEMHTLKD